MFHNLNEEVRVDRIDTIIRDLGGEDFARSVGDCFKLFTSDEQTIKRLKERRRFWKELVELTQKHSTVNQYEEEEVFSEYTYPKEYLGPKPIRDQVNTIATIFGLDPTVALKKARNLPTLPEGAEGWFAIPKVSAVAKKHFPKIIDTGDKYCGAVKLVHTKLAENRSFYSSRHSMVSSELRQHVHTLDFLEQIETEQKGEILIVAAQYGMRHRGKSVRRARETFATNEFGLGAFHVGCMTLVHPERYVCFEELDTDCPGDEYAPGKEKVGEEKVFSGVPFFNFYENEFKFGIRFVSSPHVFYGSVSAFVPQN